MYKHEIYTYHHNQTTTRYITDNEAVTIIANAMNQAKYGHMEFSEDYGAIRIKAYDENNNPYAVHEIEHIDVFSTIRNAIRERCYYVGILNNERIKCRLEGLPYWDTFDEITMKCTTVYYLRLVNCDTGEYYEVSANDIWLFEKAPDEEATDENE